MIEPDARNRATWGDRPDRPRMRLVAWRPVTKGALRGFATVELPIGLKIHDCPVFTSHGKTWATLPGKPQIDKEGRQKADCGGSGFLDSGIS
jgi:hypothetical protein